MPKVSMVVVMMESLCAGLGSSTKRVRTRNQTEMSRSARPTTTRPMTAPLRNASRRPASSDWLAACATRAAA